MENTIDSRDIKKHKTDILKLIATASITQPVPLPKNVYHTVMYFADSVEEELPSQSLQDALGVHNADIRLYIETLRQSITQT